MNLRDQLLKAGLASKKDVAKAEQELKKQANVEQGHREARRVVEAREAAAAEQARREREAELIERRRGAAARDASAIRELRCRQILRAHQLRVKSGPQRFWFRSFSTTEVWRLCLPERVAEDLRRGLVAAAWVDDAQPEVVLVPRDAAARVSEFRPELVLFWNPEGASADPAERLLPY